MLKRRHRHETAADHLARRVPTGAPDQTASAAVSALAGPAFDAVDTFCVVDRERRLLGIVHLPDLLRADPAARLDSLMTPATGVLPDTDQERVATRALHQQTNAVPVVDRAGVLLGVVPPEALLLILRREHVEDLHRLAGISSENKQARVALTEPPARRARHRLPWLLVGLLGSTLSALVMVRFERILHAQVAVAFFIPGIVYLADAVGTQTEAVAVRGLSLSALPLSRLIWGELKTGLLIGLLLGGLACVGVLAAFQNFRLAVAVGTAILVAGSTATTVGITFPAILARLGRDPAFGSGPLATVVQDILTLLIYFEVSSALL